MAVGESCDCLSDSEGTLKDVGKMGLYPTQQNTRKSEPGLLFTKRTDCYHKISRSLEAARFGFTIFHSITVTS